MKLFSSIRSGVLRVAMVTFLAVPAAVSCFDPSGLQEQIDMLVDKVFELETKLNNEIAALQAMLNIWVVTNTIPNTGISLPFFSYGGTSLVILLAEMGVVLSVSRSANFEKT